MKQHHVTTLPIFWKQSPHDITEARTVYRLCSYASAAQLPFITSCSYSGTSLYSENWRINLRDWMLWGGGLHYLEEARHWIYRSHSKWGRKSITNESRVCFQAIISKIFHTLCTGTHQKLSKCSMSHRWRHLHTIFSGIKNWRWWTAVSPHLSPKLFASTADSEI